jgi:hypothetical protein
VKRTSKPEPIRRDRNLVVLRRRMEEYAAGLEPRPQREDDEPPSPTKPGGAAAVQAHLLGQEGQKRGLRGGPEVLEKARSSYLEMEYAGPRDRRTKKGRIAKTEI